MHSTPPLRPRRAARSLPVFPAHSLTVPSLLPEASVLPSGLYATHVAPPACPPRVDRSPPSWADDGPGTSPKQNNIDAICDLIVTLLGNVSGRVRPQAGVSAWRESGRPAH